MNMFGALILLPALAYFLLPQQVVAAKSAASALPQPAGEV
jgi:hypothetical protein